ncbi:cilia- and flagella-associated protein 97 [Mugil cephalus]|uniref:cilia- and flagella-associated protein 97 n=1 Tax=Mugil cephalus TaxID=48193 RepID=UPI001FB7E9D5|nr:cilia- and flagella-associated protein 97 [Mugil cephalus]
MFNPSELEGEVDHSFFDSDCDEGTGDGGKRMEKGSKAEKESTHTKRIERNAKDDISPKTNKTRINLKRVENDSSNRIENKERSRLPSVSSVSCVSDEVVRGHADGDGGSNLHKRANGSFMALLADAREANDIYTESGSETEEEALSFNVSKKSKNKPPPKKLLRSRQTRSPSPTSTDTSADADSESSYTGSSRRSSSESPTLPRPNRSSSCSGVRRRGSEGSQDLLNTCTDESEDTVTDVSPLSSSDTSPLQSLDLKHTEVETEVEERSRKEQQQQQQHPQQEEESVPSSGLSHMHHAPEDSDQDVDDCSLSLESQLGSKLVIHHPGGRNRKNYSFTNDEVRRIDRENQRLLRELSRVSPGPRPRSAVGMKTHVASNSSLIRLSHSALNRQREQQRIERDNMAFLKRLESVKPTPGMKRTEQLADYQRHVRYQGAPLYPISMSTTGKERSSTRTPSACPRPTRSRTAFVGTDSSSAPVTRSKKLSAPRPAWS